MPTSKETQDKLKRGVEAAEAARNKVRQRPRLANLAKLPGDGKTLLDLQAYTRKATDHLQRMVQQSEVAFAKIVKDKTEQYEHHGMTPGEKPNIWSYDPGFDAGKVVRLRDKAIEKAKQAHGKTTEGPRTDIIGALRSVRADLNTAEPLFHSQVAMLLRMTNSDGKRAQYARVLANAGVVAIENAVLDCVMGEGNRALGAAIITILENDEKLQSRVKYSREDIADLLVHDDFWLAQQAIGLTRYAIEQAECAVLTLEGKAISTDRKMKAGLMRHELEKAVGKTFDDSGNELDPEGEIVKPAASPDGESHDEFYDRLTAESRARDIEVNAEKRKQAAAARKVQEDEVLAITKRTEAEENALYGGGS